jgi:SAM-dependent methyltransferase
MHDLIWVIFIYPLYAARLTLRQVPLWIKQPKWCWIELNLGLYYFFVYPFFRHIYEKLKTEKDISELVYGETPLSTFEKVMSYCSLQDSTHFLDLGCGKGHLVFYAHLAYGIHATGIEVIPTFVRMATKWKQKMNLGVEFKEEDILNTEVSNADIIWVTTTCLNVDTQTRLAQKLAAETKPDCTIVSVTHPLEGEFITLKTLNLPFSWSPSTVYIQSKC